MRQSSIRQLLNWETSSTVRNKWLETIAAAADNGRCDLMIISADLGYGVFEKFEDEHPDQFLNCGVAEQNMVGLAAGMALTGRKLFCYSIGNFPTLRCLEQIRNDVCYHDLDVCITSVGAGFGYGQLGMSHHATEDIAIMRALPNQTCYIPFSDANCVQITQRILDRQGPAYLRLERSSSDQYSDRLGVEFANPFVSHDNHADILVVSCGGISSEAAALVQHIEDSGRTSKHMIIQSFEDIDIDSFVSELRAATDIVSVEEGVLTGGLGSFIAETMQAHNTGGQLFANGLPGRYITDVGDQNFLRKATGLTADAIWQGLQGKLS